MKKQYKYAILLLVISLCVNCKKDAIPVSASLIGTWELRENISGQTGQPTHYNTGNGNIMKFTATNYEIYSTNSLVKSGTYKVKKDTFSLDHTLRDRIIYDNQDNSIRTFFAIENNQLNLFIDAYDAPSVIYQRVK
ncbi:MAG: hypothetical protein ACXVB0_07100 [Mucilaginibacter sp.]